MYTTHWQLAYTDLYSLQTNSVNHDKALHTRSRRKSGYSKDIGLPKITWANKRVKRPEITWHTFVLPASEKRMLAAGGFVSINLFFVAIFMLSLFKSGRLNILPQVGKSNPSNVDITQCIGYHLWYHHYLHKKYKFLFLI